MVKLWYYNNSTYVVYKSYIISVYCQWSSWSHYSGCTKSCGGGTQFRTRIKTIPESDGGTCFGEKVYTRNCNVQNCPGKFTKSGMYVPFEWKHYVRCRKSLRPSEHFFSHSRSEQFW